MGVSQELCVGSSTNINNLNRILCSKSNTCIYSVQEEDLKMDIVHLQNISVLIIQDFLQ